MATSGVIGGYTDHSAIAAEIRWRRVWYDEESNRSTIRVTLYARRTNTGWTTWGHFDGGLNIHGQDYWTGHWVQLGPGDDWVAVHAVEVTLTHNSDGWLPVYIYAYGGIPGTGWNSTNSGGHAHLDRLYAWPPEVRTLTAEPADQDRRVDIWLTFGSESPRGPAESTEVTRRTVYPPEPWRTVSEAQGKAHTHVDRTTQPNKCYEYDARTRNRRGTSAWHVGDWVYTTPAAPHSVTAAKNDDLSITVRWTNGAAYTPDSFEIWDNGTFVAEVSGSVDEWTHYSPDSGQTHSYVVKARKGNLWSADSEPSNTVAVLTPPLAPTGLSPSGDIWQNNIPVTFRWTHNPRDTTGQQAYELRYRMVGSQNWTTLTGTTESSRTVLIPNQHSYEWQVRTRGMHGTFSPMSTMATFRLVTPGSVTITAPYDGEPVGVATLNVTWSWSQLQLIPQSIFEARLMDADGYELERYTGSGPVFVLEFYKTRLVDNTTYTVEVNVRAGTNLTATDSVTFTTAFPTPPSPLVDATWNDRTGTVSVEVVEGTDGLTDAVSIDLDRSVDGGNTWEPIVTGGPKAGYAVEDTEALSCGTTLYRATAWSDLPSSSETIFELVTTSDSVWLSGGPSFALTARLRYDPERSVTTGRERAAVRYEGRELPVAYSGDQIAREVTLKGATLEDEDDMAQQLEAVAYAREPMHLYRDPSGLRIYGSLSDVSVTRSVPGRRGFTFRLTEATHNHV